MPHRVFVGLHISPSLQKEIVQWGQKFHKHIPARWIQGRNLHITLLPPWETDDTDSILQKLQNIEGKFEPIPVEFHTVEYGPYPKSPRLIWAKAKTPRKIIELYNKLTYFFPKQKEKRKFLLHLTLARFRRDQFSRFLTKHLNLPIKWQETFHEITLFESRLLPGGAQYEVLGKIPFSHSLS